MSEVKNFALEELKKKVGVIFDKKALASQILETCPCYYDSGHNWWMWNWPECKWQLTDETDILNAVEKEANINTINAKEKNEIIEALKQESRKNKPSEIKPTWLQFMDEIYDVKTGEKFKAMPHWFVTNPMPHRLDEKYILTPTMDRIFEEWVGKDHVKTLYEIIAYCMLPDYPIHRLFCLIGSGMNGKSCFLRLLKKVIGETNVTATELDTLIGSRFEVTRLHKKLVCIMGETNFNEISRTSILKKLTGQDLIGFEYKNKTPFDGTNYAKIIIATNNLPTTTDKTIGFYRRWMIIDFPNRFSEQKEILDDIPEEEYSALALKCAWILKDLLQERKFTNEGTVEERAEKYEAKSNFLDKFIQEFTEEDVNGNITKADFYKKFIAWSKENRHREMSETSLGISMKKKGIDSGKKYFDWLYDGKGGDARIWIGIKWKE